MIMIEKGGLSFKWRYLYGWHEPDYSDWWFVLFGMGIAYKNLRLHRPMFSERFLFEPVMLKFGNRLFLVFTRKI